LNSGAKNRGFSGYVDFVGVVLCSGYEEVVDYPRFTCDRGGVVCVPLYIGFYRVYDRVAVPVLGCNREYDAVGIDPCRRYEFARRTRAFGDFVVEGHELGNRVHRVLVGVAHLGRYVPSFCDVSGEHYRMFILVESFAYALVGGHRKCGDYGEYGKRDDRLGHAKSPSEPVGGRFFHVLHRVSLLGLVNHDLFGGYLDAPVLTVTV